MGLEKILALSLGRGNIIKEFGIKEFGKTPFQKV
jgi:hypothetical protein